MDAASEIVPGVSEVTKQLSGEIGLIFSNRAVADLQPVLEQFSFEDYARFGATVEAAIELPEGPLCFLGGDRCGEPVSHTQESYLRSLGLPTTLKNGVVLLTRSFDVCSPGDKLTVAQANILRALDLQLATVSVNLLGTYSQENGWKSL